MEGLTKLILWAVVILVVLSFFQHKDTFTEEPLDSFIDTTKWTYNKSVDIYNGYRDKDSHPSNITILGKPNCKSNEDCLQFGENVLCLIETGECYV